MSNVAVMADVKRALPPVLLLITHGSNLTLDAYLFSYHCLCQVMANVMAGERPLLESGEEWEVCAYMHVHA